MAKSKKSAWTAGHKVRVTEDVWDFVGKGKAPMKEGERGTEKRGRKEETCQRKRKREREREEGRGK